MGADRLDDLCQAAEATAQSRGHELEEWRTPGGEESVARATVCRRCGRAAYVRVEPAMAGAAGPALTQVCDGGPST